MNSANEIFYSYKMQQIAEEKCPRLKTHLHPLPAMGSCQWDGHLQMDHFLYIWVNFITTSLRPHWNHG